MPKTKKRPDGRYRQSVYIGTENGKKRYKYFYGSSEREAKKKAEEYRKQLNDGFDLSANNTFGFWCGQFVKQKRVAVGDSQADLYEARLKYFLCYDYSLGLFSFERNCALSAVPITEVKLWQLQTVIDALAKNNPYTKKPSAKRTLQAIKRSAIDVFDYAIMNRVTNYNPAQGLVLPFSAKIDERRALTAEEQKRIREFDHRARIPALLMMLCGLRRGEATALKYADLDFEEKTIRINKSYDFKNNAVKPPKTKAGYRTVPIPTELVKLLDAQPKQSVFVVCGVNGKPMTETAWKRLLEAYLHDMNLQYGTFQNKPNKFDPRGVPMTIQPFTWHCLRHTYATILYDAGVDVLTAKKLLGHSDIKTTLGIYTHLSAEKEKINIDRLNSFLDCDGQSNGQKSQNR